MKLENEAKTIMKPTKALWVYGCFFIYNLISIQWSIFTYKSLFYAPCFYFHDHFSPYFYSGLCQLLIWWVFALFNCLNMYNLVKSPCKCLQFIVSYLQVVFLISKDFFYLKSSLVNSYHTIPQLLFAWKDLRHYLGI